MSYISCSTSVGKRFQCLLLFQAEASLIAIWSPRRLRISLGNRSFPRRALNSPCQSENISVEEKRYDIALPRYDTTRQKFRSRKICGADFPELGARNELRDGTSRALATTTPQLNVRARAKKKKKKIRALVSSARGLEEVRDSFTVDFTNCIVVRATRRASRTHFHVARSLARPLARVLLPCAFQRECIARSKCRAQFYDGDDDSDEYDDGDEKDDDPLGVAFLPLRIVHPHMLKCMCVFYAYLCMCISIYYMCLKCRGTADPAVSALYRGDLAAGSQRRPSFSPWLFSICFSGARGFLYVPLEWQRARRPAIASVLHRLQYGSQTGSRWALALLVAALSPIHNRRKSRRRVSFREYRSVNYSPVVEKYPVTRPASTIIGKKIGPRLGTIPCNGHGCARREKRARCSVK